MTRETEHSQYTISYPKSSRERKMRNRSHAQTHNAVYKVDALNFPAVVVTTIYHSGTIVHEEEVLLKKTTQDAYRNIATTLACLTLLLTISTSDVARAETQLLKKESVALNVGTVLSYTTRQKKYINDTFTMMVEITEPVRDSAGLLKEVHMSWTAINARKSRNRKITGEVHTTGLQAGRRLNCTWPRQKAYTSTETFAWLSRDVCEELKVLGTTELSLDASILTGRPLHFRRSQDLVPHTIELQGHETTLTGLELTSSRGDRLLVLNDCENPLILEAKVVGLVSWRLDTIDDTRVQ